LGRVYRKGVATFPSCPWPTTVLPDRFGFAAELQKISPVYTTYTLTDEARDSGIRDALEAFEAAVEVGEMIGFRDGGAPDDGATRLAKGCCEMVVIFSPWPG
jgi:hypothetical protein